MPGSVLTLHLRNLDKVIVLGVGEAEDTSFLASLTPFLVLYPAGTILGDRIKEYCVSEGIKCRAAVDDDEEIISDIVIFNKKRLLHLYMKMLPQARQHIVIQKGFQCTTP